LKKQRVNIFPNPFKDNLSLEASEKIKHLQLFDMQGNLIFEEKNVFDSRELSFSFLTHGVYFLKIQFEKNTFVQKLIKI